MTVLQVETELAPLQLDPDGPRVVAVGGGHGLAVTLQAVQTYAGSITAVVSVGDDGGSSGRLTSSLGIPAPGDIRRCLLALTPEPTLSSELFAYRFRHSDVGGHAFGNLALAALTDLLGDFARAVDAAADLLGAVGRVVPAALQPLHLTAEVGQAKVEGQVAIARARGGVGSLTVGPPGVVANPEAVEAIGAADQIVLGPGSLYTSLLATLLVPGLGEAFRRAGATRVFVLNLVSQDGETLGMDGGAHLAALAELAGVRGPGSVVTHTGPLEVPPGLSAVSLDPTTAARWGWRLVEADVSAAGEEWPAHDPIKLGRVLAALAPR